MNLVFSDEFTQDEDGQQLRKFQIEVKLDPDAEVDAGRAAASRQDRGGRGQGGATHEIRNPRTHLRRRDARPAGQHLLLRLHQGEREADDAAGGHPRQADGAGEPAAGDGRHRRPGSARSTSFRRPSPSSRASCRRRRKWTRSSRKSGRWPRRTQLQTKTVKTLQERARPELQRAADPDEPVAAISTGSTRSCCSSRSCRASRGSRR